MEADKKSAAENATEDLAPPQRKARFTGPFWLLWWYLEWAIPGLGMFSEAYIIFSAGQIAIFQQVAYPECFFEYKVCDANMIQHVASYIQICGIIAGMLFWGYLGDYTGRKWGSRSVAAIMLSGVIMLTFTPFVNDSYGYFAFFMTAQTWYGFGVGGEYPMASASAAERSATTPELRHLRAQQVILVFSNQGMGNLANASAIAICMAIFNQTGPVNTQGYVMTYNPKTGVYNYTGTMTPDGSKKVLELSYGFGAIACVVMVLYRFIYLEESEMFIEEEGIEGQMNTKATGVQKQLISLKYWGLRQVIASGAWIANDFAFYGNKLQQGLFLGILFPQATPYIKQQWNILNSFISLLGYYLAAALCDKPWYGRRTCQTVGFMAMFIFYIIIYGQWDNMALPTSTVQGAQALQALYYLASFFNQFGPNATTWLVAGEIFPTDIRSTYHGFAASMGKLGAIIASLWISYIVNKRDIYLISAIWGLGGAIFTFLMLPDTTGLDLEEYDRMQRCILEGRFQDYHGEAVNPKHLSLVEIFILGWNKQYNPELDREQFEADIKTYALTGNSAGVGQMQRMSLATGSVKDLTDKASHMVA